MSVSDRSDMAGGVCYGYERLLAVELILVGYDTLSVTFTVLMC